MGCELRRVPEIHRSFETPMRLCKTHFSHEEFDLLVPALARHELLATWSDSGSRGGQGKLQKLRNLSDRTVLVGFVASGPDDTCHHTHA